MSRKADGSAMVEVFALKKSAYALVRLLRAVLSAADQTRSLGIVGEDVGGVLFAIHAWGAMSTVRWRPCMLRCWR
jgi:hypothetical protein